MYDTSTLYEDESDRFVKGSQAIQIPMPPELK